MTDKHIASLIIIGDEILRGQVQDANTMYLAKSLLNIGIKIRRIVIIPDEVDVIGTEVAEASKNYPMVFTSGGIGPTHDDLTYAGVAQGLGLEFKEDPRLVERLAKLFPDQPESRRMATVPQPCDFVDVTSRNLNGETYAIVKVRNIYILPGSPRYFRPAVDAIIRTLDIGKTIYNESIDVDLDELGIVAILDEQAKRWHGAVNIGSYPQQTDVPRTRITLEGNNRDTVKKAKREIEMMLPKDKMRGIRIFDEEYAKRVYESKEQFKHVQHAFQIVEECYDKYNSDEIFVSFNGGKDCTVVLHLAATLAKIRKLDPPLCLYITGDAFPEVDEFVQEAVSYYGFELIQRAGPIRDALGSLLAERPKLRACLLGTRKNDPGARLLEPFAPTDPGWPDIMRVSPIIDWTYSQVWHFLLRHEVAYCSLYDDGYTSLGARDTTTKNPLLRDPNNPSIYLPAHTLTDDSAERHGRV